MDRVNLARRNRGAVFVLAVVGCWAVSPQSRSYAQAQQYAPTTSPQEGQTSQPRASGFLNRVFRDESGSHKYVLFVPQNYDPSAKWPVIVYLHGAGERGNDGVAQTTVGMAPFVKARSSTFPFIVVFPQCEDTRGPILTAWSANSPDGKRALAILDSVEKDFAVDSKRCVLTGWSMGGYGTWSLGASDPSRWSALVPVSGGGNPEWGAKLAKIPIWAFAGAHDDIVRVDETQRMIDSVRAAGGKPTFTIVPNAGHDVWKTAYNDDAVYEWMYGSSSQNTAVSGRPAYPASRAAGAPVQAEIEEPFVPAVSIPNAVGVRLGNVALKALAQSAMQFIPPDALTGRINDISSSTSSSGYTFGVQFSNISYSGRVARVFIKAYAQDRLNVQLAVSNVTLMIGSTYVQGSGRSAVAGPIYVVVGHRYPVWMSFDVTPFIDNGKLRMQLVAARFNIPDDDWYVTPPYGVSTSGLGMTSDRVSSGLVEGIYGQKYRIEQEAVGIVPSLLARVEGMLDLTQVTEATNAFWPLPVYRPRLHVWPESVQVDDKGVSLVMGIVAAAADPRKAPSRPRVERSAGVSLEAIPRSTELELGIAPGILEPLTQMLIEENVARINVLDIPNKAFAQFADRKVLSEILPELGSLPPTSEILSELVLESPITVRDARAESTSPGGLAPSGGLAHSPPGAVSVTAMKANASAVNGTQLSGGSRPFDFVVPKAVIAISVKNGPQDKDWRPFANLQVDLSQLASASVVRPDFSERALQIDWSGEPQVRATAKFAEDYKPKNRDVRTDKLRDAFLSAWKGWTQSGPASQVAVPDVDFKYAKMRLDGVKWSPPVLSVRFDEPGIKITNTTKVDLVYETKDIYSGWSEPITLKPGKTHDFKITDSLLFRRVVGEEFVQMYTLPIGKHFEFKSPATGGPPNLFAVKARAAAH